MKELGIDGLVLLAQIVNFGILFFVFKKFVYARVLKMLDDRREEISHGLKMAKAAEEQEAKMKEKQEKLTQEARRDARHMVEDAKKQADKERKDIIAKAHEEAHTILAKARVQADKQQEAQTASMRSEAVELAIEMTRRLLGSDLSKEDHRKLLNAKLKEITRAVA